MTLKEATAVCLDRIITLGRGYVTQVTWIPFVDEAYDVWIYGEIKSAQEYLAKCRIPLLKMNPDFAQKLIIMGWIEQIKTSQSTKIWQVSTDGFRYYDSVELSDKNG